MNEKISWHQSIIKKYSSSNHFKLLNQLRTEVKKYPLNKKQNISSNRRNDSKYDKKDNQIKSITKDVSISNNSNFNSEINSGKSTVSFNNSKNFSIYNSKSKDSLKENVDSKLLEVKNNNEEYPLSSFKDRLNKIDMK